MAGYFLVAVLAAFGALSALWAAFGWLLPVCSSGWLVCPGRPGTLFFVPLYLWLRWAGLVRCPLILADMGLDDDQRAQLERKGIEIYSLEELSERLRIGAEEIGRGNGNPAGRCQRRGVSEL